MSTSAQSYGNAALAATRDASLSTPKYRRDIDGLRAIAVMLVVVFHAFPKKLSGGFVGVDIFFVISGFLISTIILESISGGGFSYIEFYERRVRRIFPALIVVLSACFALGWVALLSDEYMVLGKHMAAGAGFVSNLVLWGEAGYFDTAADTKPLLHLWSLGVEEQFYILWPILLGLAWKRRLNGLAVISLVAVISFAVNIATVDHNSVEAFYSPLSRFWELLIGATLAYLSLRKSPSIPGSADARAIVGALLIAVSVALLGKNSAFPGWWALLPTVGAFLVISAGNRAWLNRNVLSSRPLVWIGLISYPLYLWHWPLLSFARIIENGEPSSVVRVGCIALSFVLAWGTYRFIERPVRAHSHNRLLPVLLVAMIALIGVLGLGTYRNNGFEARHDGQRFPNPTQLGAWKYWTNSACESRYPFDSKDAGWWFCVQNKSERPAILLLGNSYANHLFPGLAKNSVTGRLSILNVGTCGPELNVKTTVAGDKNNPCFGDRKAKQTAFLDGIIKTDRPKYVILNTWWPTFSPDGALLDRSGKVAGKLSYTGGSGREGDETSLSAYLRGLEERVASLEQVGSRTIVFLPKPQIDSYKIKDCFARPLKPATASCNLDAADQEAKRKPLVDGILAIKARHPNLLVFDQMGAFCSSGRCAFIRDSKPLLRDESEHLSEYGSDIMAGHFVRWTATNAPDIFGE